MKILDEKYLNSVRQAITLAELLHSEDFEHAFSQMSKDEFSFDYKTISVEEAHALLNIFNLSEAIITLIKLEPAALALIPENAISGFRQANKQLKGWEDFLANVAQKKDFDREKFVLKFVASTLNKRFLEDRLRNENRTR